MRYIFLTTLLLCFFQLFSQTGNYFLSHYSPSEDRLSNVCFDILQDEQGLFYFATRNGILDFDGRNWELLPSRGAVYSIQRAGDQLYWAGVSGFGTITRDEHGARILKQLSPQGVGDVFESLIVKNKPYFLTEQTLYTYSDKGITEIKATDQTGSFVGLFELFESIYVTTERDGVFKVENGNKLVRNMLAIPKGEEVIFVHGLNNQYLIALSNNKVFLCGENLRLREITLEDKNYIDASVVVNGSWINRDLFVLGTLRGGMIFIHTATGRTQEIINYNTGLPDNEVYAIMSDKGQNIWAAHEYGFTRVSPYLPFRSFNHYPGLNGNLLCAHTFQNKVYVGTSLGLYTLEKEELFDEITYYEDVVLPLSVEKKIKDEQVVAQPETTNATTEVESKKGLLRFLKRNRNKQIDPNAVRVPENVPVTKEEKNGSTPAKQHYVKRVKKTQRVLHASQYVYKKINAIDAKVTQLLEFNGKLISIGLGGVYAVEGNTALPILEEPVRMGYASTTLGALMISTYADAIKTFTYQSGKWIASNLLPNVHDQITFILDGVSETVWFFALDKAYQLKFENGEAKSVVSTDINNPGFEDVIGIRLAQDIVIANTQGFFRYEAAQNEFIKIDSLPAPVQYVTKGESILFKDSHNWRELGKAADQSNLQLLNLSKNLRFISGETKSDNLWIITGSNELFKFFGEMFTPYDAGYPLLLRMVRNGNVLLDPRHLDLDETKMSLLFEVSKPDYLAAEAIEYRYQLKGLENVWSDWSTQHNVVDFPYLPAGDYTLLFQARDVLGKTSELPALTFEVLPPYWKRPWFYALEIFVFASFVMLSFRLSTRYRIVSRLLSLLTIIMLIQFIETVISETLGTRASPVTDFFMQVVVAFLILPVEGYLRNLMLRSLDSQSGLYKFLTPKRETPSAEKQGE